MIKSYTAKTEADMCSLGVCLAGHVFPGAFIVLFGGLGAGKTTLVRSFSSALGLDPAASPTFTIVRKYSGEKVSVSHFDCYRLADADELYAVGFDDYLGSDDIIMMEWSENVYDALPGERLEIEIAGSGDDPRQLELRSFGEKYDELLEELEIC